MCMSANEQMSKPQFRRIITTLCQRWHIPEYSNYLSERYWLTFARFDDTGQRAFWDVLGVQEENEKETVDAVCDDRSPARRH
jgi:hypothetical protein